MSFTTEPHMLGVCIYQGTRLVGGSDPVWVNLEAFPPRGLLQGPVGVMPIGAPFFLDLLSYLL